MSEATSGTPERVRFTIDLPPALRDQMAEKAKIHNVTQGEFFEALLLTMDLLPPDALMNQTEPMYKAKLDARAAAREQRRTLLQAASKLSPEKQAELLALAGQVQS